MFEMIGAALEFGVFAPEELVGQLEDEGLVGLGDTEDAGDHLEWMDRRNARDEVTLALTPEIVDQLARGLLDQRLQALDRARHEVGARDLAELPVLRRIHVDDRTNRGRRIPLERFSARDRHAWRVQEDFGQLRDLDDVRASGDRPERREAGGLEILDGRFASQARPLGMGQAMLAVGTGIDELAGVDDGGHGASVREGTGAQPGPPRKQNPCPFRTIVQRRAAPGA